MPPEKDKKFTEDFIRKWSKAGGVPKKKRISKNERILKNQEEILKKDPRNHKIWFARGILLAEMGRYDEAIRCFDAVMKLDPSNKAVNNSKASALMSMGKLEESAKWYRQALLMSAEEIDGELRARLAEEVPVEETIRQMIKEEAQWLETARTRTCPICGSTVLWEARVCPTCEWEFHEEDFKELPPEEERIRPEAELTEEELRERLIQKVETYRLEGFEVGPIVRTMKTEPHRAKSAVAQFEENVAEIKKFRKHLDSLDTSEFKTQLVEIEQLFRTPYNIFAIRNEYEKLVARIEARMGAKPRVPTPRRPAAEGLTNGLRGRVNGLDKERAIGLTNGRGRVNGMVNGRGRVNGLTNGLTNGLGRVNGMVNGRGRVNGVTNGLVYRFQTMKTGLVNGLTNGNGITNGLGSIRFQNETKLKRWKLSIIPIVILLLLTLPLFVYVEVPVSDITVDGDFDDWSGVTKIASRRDLTLPNRNIDITGVAAKDNGRLLSLYMSVDNVALSGDTLSGVPDTMHLLLDTDNDPTTGYAVRGIGADHAVRVLGTNGSIRSAQLLLFSPYADQANWSAWDVAGHPAAAVSSGMLETQVSLGILGTNGDRIAVLAHAHSHDGYSDFSDHVISNQKGVLKIDQSWSQNAEAMSGTNQVILTAAAGAVGGKVRLESATIHLTGDAEPDEILRLRLLSGEEELDLINNPSTKDITFTFDRVEIDEDGTIVLTVDATFSSTSGNTLGARFAYSNDFGLSSGIASLTETYPDGRMNYIASADTANVDIDGGFSDWPDTENDSGNETIENPNIDMQTFASRRVQSAFPILRTDGFFYLNVAGRMAGGSLVPYKSPGPLKESAPLRDSDKDTVPDDIDEMPHDFNNDHLDDADTNHDYDGDGVPDFPFGDDYYLETTIPSSFPEPFRGREVRVYIGPRPTAKITGEDYLNIYIDINGDVSGYAIGPMFADYLLSIRGKNSEITYIEFLQYGGTGTDWVWTSTGRSADAAVDRRRLEASADMTSIGGSRFDVIFETSDWKTEKDFATNLSWSGRSATRGSYGEYDARYESPSYSSFLTDKADKVSFVRREASISWEVPRYVMWDDGEEAKVLGDLIPSDMVLEQRRAFYDDAYSSLDISIEYLFEDARLKENIVLEGEIAGMDSRGELSFVSRIDYTNGLMIQAEGEASGDWAEISGGLTFKDRDNEKFHVASPFAVDSAGDVLDCHYLYSVAEKLLDLRCPSDWFSGASYPVIIDPTITTYTLENDDGTLGQASEFFGWSVAVGDFDDDGYADVATGAPWADIGSYSNAGAVYVYFGPFSASDTTPDVKIVANITGAHLGWAIAAGILNDDDYWDLVVTQIDNDAYAYYGFPGWSGWDNSPNVTFDLSSFRETNTRNFGNAVAVGNVDYDGTPLNFEDVIFGANLSDIPGDGSGHTDGMAFVFYSVFIATEITEDAKIEPYEDSNDGEFATSLACGRINNDNNYDVVVGEPQNNSGDGTVHIYYGDNIGTGGTYNDDVYLEDEYGGENFGHSVAVGNMDSDSYMDILVGAPKNDEYGSVDRGRAYVFQANTDGSGITDSVAPTRDLAGPNNANGAEFGYSVAIGDFEGDGVGDAIVGARYNASGGTSRGAVMIFDDPISTNNVTDHFIDGTQNSEYLGWSLAARKFANDDVLVVAAGASYWDDSSPSETNAGRIMIILIPEFSDMVLFSPLLLVIPLAIRRKRKSLQLRGHGA